MSNQDPIFNFTSYLCSPDGCKVILWKRTTAVPSRGSFLASGAAMGSAGEGHHQKWGWMSRNKSCFKVDSDTQISMGALQSLLDKKKKKKGKKPTWKTTNPLAILMPTMASVFICFPLINNGYTKGRAPLKKPGENKNYFPAPLTFSISSSLKH